MIIDYNFFMNPLQSRYNQLLASSQQFNASWGKNQNPEAANITSDVVNLILSEAISLRASDIHIEPRQNQIRIRFRIDGKLQDVLLVTQDVNVNIIPRLKILAELPTDPGSSKKALDGRFTMSFGKLSFDFRLSSLPTVLGDKIAIRILNKSSEVINLKNIGLRPTSYETLESIFLRKRGLIVVNGPTGAGKTTTLYSILQHLHTPDVNIITLENPVEYQIDGINQCDVNKKNSETFSSALRVTLRQDPDIILIGEIRDLESAEIAIRASITGHLVMTSLHANSALGSVARLVNMGLERHLVSYAMTGAVAQHLLPRICEGCRTPYKVDIDQFRKMCVRGNIDPALFLKNTPELTLYKGAGCPKCNGSGYYGRIGIFEVVQFNEDLREAIIRNASVVEMENIAAKSGFQSIALDAMQKAMDGIVHIDDIYPILLDRS